MKRDRILDIVKKYIENEPTKKFIPGETRIWASGATWDADDVASLVDVALDRWYGGKVAHEFERFMATVIGQRYVTLCNSGSSANLLALSCLTSKRLKERALKKGDEIITVAAGFPTTVNPIIQNGLIPVFIDINLPGYNALPNAVSEAISDKTKAIMIAHTLGNPYRAKEIREIADQNGLFIIGDNCDSLGAEHHGKPLPYWADISTFSFFPAHIISTGEGGAVSTNDSLLDSIIRSFRDWGRACFPAGTKVEANGLQKNIEDVEIGDVVISHTGALRRVTQLTGKTDTEFVKIKPRLMKEIVCTNNHPFFASGESWIPAHSLKKGDCVLEALPTQAGHSPEDFTYSYDTEYQTKTNSLKIEPDLMRLIGYWLAEGSLASGSKGKSGYKKGSNYLFHRVDFAFNVKEKETIEDVCELMCRYFGVSVFARQKPGTLGISISFKTRSGYEFFLQFFGKGASKKHLPFSMENWNLSLGLDQLIKGFWVGDGSSSKQGFSLCSTSETLINQIRRILLRYEIAGSFHERKPSAHIPSDINGKKVIARHALHSIGFYGKYAERFGHIVGEDFSRNGTKESGVFFDADYVYYPIDKIENVSLATPVTVYNLEVEVDHSYHANGIAVHNCWCAVGKDNTCGKRYEWQLGNLPFGFDHKYIYSEIGYNFKATDLQAALGVSQIKKLPKFVETRRDNWKFYREHLNEFNEHLIMPEPTAYSKPSWFGFTISIKEKSPFTRTDLISFLDQNKIDSRMLFAGNIVRHPAYMDIRHRVSGTLHKSDFVTKNTFWIGVAPVVTRPMQNYVVEKFAEFMKRYK